VLTLKDYVRAESLTQAYELNQKKSNRILGGMLWLKMTHLPVQTGIDLSGLRLNTIEETPDEFLIGCMTPLRDLELHQELNRYTQGAVRESLRHIVGVQFRNLATVGGSTFGRFGFSDVLTMLMALDTDVELYSGGILSLAQFAAMAPDRDILIRIRIKKTPRKSVYLSHRNSQTDLPVLTCALSGCGSKFQAVIGARPGRAVRIPDEQRILSEGITSNTADRFAEYVSRQIVTGTNMRASADYRRHLAEVLTRRAVLTMGGERL